ncbi:MAG TPA: hypothetical protein VFY36_01605 [Solirubrobacteraceae bacterium]|nr:hypothetical protein [Solirubrobacteraceae bacterium]
MSPRLRIPEPYVPGLTAVAALDPKVADELLAAVQTVPHLLTTSRLVEHVRDKVPALDKAEDVLDALLSLTTLLPEGGDGVSELARDVAESPDLDLDEAARHELVQRLEGLLGVDSFVLAARASEIVTEFPKVFHEARILTDLRPVFGPDPTRGPQAALLVATLKLEYHLADGPVDVDFFALDYSDLLRLREIVDRAIAKHTSLRGLIDKMDLPYWEYREFEERRDAD